MKIPAVIIDLESRRTAREAMQDRMVDTSGETPEPDGDSQG